MNYSQYQKKQKIDQISKTTENFDHILFNLNRFNKVKTIDEDIFHEAKDEGVQLYDRFKQLVIQLSEEESEMAADFKQLNIVSTPSSPPAAPLIKSPGQSQQADKVPKSNLRSPTNQNQQKGDT